MNSNLKATLACAVVLLMYSSLSGAAITKVGNGDDGSDLEKATTIKSGILIETRNRAVRRLKELDVKSIEHLGILIPELERSDIFLVKADVHPKTADDQGMEGSNQNVFARTFAEPHAATRFFPAALELSEDQLMALHIHEALHRSLPASVRENEGVVSKITLAIAAPDATRDRVIAAVESAIPEETVSHLQGANGQPITVVVDRYRNVKVIQESDLSDMRTSTLGYAFHTFFAPDSNQVHVPIESLNTLSAQLYPFGSRDWSYGIGIDFTYIHDADQAYLGPMDLSARTKFRAAQDFEIEGYVSRSMYMVGAQELQNSPLGRDVTTAGVNFNRRIHDMYFNTDLSYSLDSDANQLRSGQANSSDNGEYIYHYGGVTSVGFHSGFFVGNFELGGFVDATLADSYRVQGPNSTYDSGRYRIIGAGPELAYLYKDFRFNIAARWVIDSTAGLRLDDLGDLMGQGLGQGYATTSAIWRF